MNRRSFFDHHAGGWDEARHPADEGGLDRVVCLAEVASGQRVLDVGAGTGVLIPHLLAALGPAGRVAAVDTSLEMLRRAAGKGFSPAVSLLCSDVHRLPFAAESFDRVICNAALPHFEDRAAALDEMVRTLRPGGALVISHPIGRAAVNALHRDVGGPVSQDRVPAPGPMQRALEAVGLDKIEVVDEPEFYLARGWKPASG